AQQLELIKAGINGNVRMVDIAAVPDDFVSPKRAMLIGAATMAGFVAGIALAFARDFLFGGLTSAAQIERHSGLRVLAVMPAATRRRRFARAPAPLLAGVRPSNPALERLREFGEPLLSMLSGTHSNVVLIASPAPGTGASFASANLAAALALEGRRVLLIDGDRHRGELRQYFAGDRRRASCEPPLPAPDPGGAVEHTGIEALDTLDFLPACTAPRESPGDTTSERMRHALAYAAVNYDVVVIDAPPLLATRDGAELARLAGVVLLVARCDVTTAGELAEAAGRLGRLGLAANGVLLNGVRLRSRHLAFRPKFGPYHPVSYRYETTPNETSPNQTVFNLTGLVCAVRRIYGSLRKESR
ncbi:MAG TPA: GNVR domain-containing protein, partial [Trinickia sp.]|nr:GNVR domain-containing protein [Trinickia sp.]